MRRQGMTYRLHDFGPFTVGLDPEGRAGSHSPTFFIVFRYVRKRKDMTNWGPGCEYVKTYHTFNWRLPVISFARAWKLRRFGALRLYGVESRIIHRIGS
jgi:hypothetical protein